MKNTTKKIFRVGLILFGIILIAIIGAFLFRNQILSEIINKTQYKFKTEYNTDFSVKKANFIGISEVEMSQILLIPKNADTLLSIDKLKTKINIYKLLTAEIQIENLELSKGYIQLVKNKKGKNFSQFLKSDKKENQETTEKRNYAKFANNLISKISNLIPENICLNNVTFKIDDLGKKLSFEIPNLTLNNEKLLTKVFVTTDTFSQVWNISGKANSRKKIADLSIKNSDSTKIKLPYVDEKLNLIAGFDDLHFKIDKIEMEQGDLFIKGMSSVGNLTVNNPKIANKDVVFEKFRFNFNLRFSSDFISLDNNSVVELNQIKVHPFAEYNSQSDVIYTFKAYIDKMKAQDFISSLPTGLFPHFEGMIANGNFAYDIYVKFNKNKPWQLTFNSNLQRENLKIIKYGLANLEKLNADFTYKAIDKGREQRPIEVSLFNPNYATLDQISPFLQKCVLTSEDPSFMTHKGFITEAFRQSILKNIRTNKFSRGASTISMQLVKNIFLTREKTISRKLEEILLVYILENNRIASKERMLEVYFNIIEWGPDIYGIGEASAFYFQKKPNDLNLNECLFLASIIPSPKKFMYQFDTTGNLKSSAEKRQDFIKKIMQKRGLIGFDSLQKLSNFKITGEARKLLNLKKLDSINVDSLSVEEF
ncbi:MAG: transglycosylase domain-containing protein [Flavobacterium sp.]|nr:transglycosylase domain-containing protein [Flavobacterium sp.]